MESCDVFLMEGEQEGIEEEGMAEKTAKEEEQVIDGRRKGAERVLLGFVGSGRGVAWERKGRCWQGRVRNVIGDINKKGVIFLRA